jgi:uncharacterized protein (DUF433 family)/membrane protease YdiL (CAAX protease family)
MDYALLIRRHPEVTLSVRDKDTIDVFAAGAIVPIYKQGGMLYNDVGNSACKGRRRMMAEIDRITIDPEVCSGQPTIRGMRITVSMVLEQIAAGMTSKEIIDAYPELEEEDVQQALRYAAGLSSEMAKPLPMGGNLATRLPKRQALPRVRSGLLVTALLLAVFFAYQFIRSAIGGLLPPIQLVHVWAMIAVDLAVITALWLCYQPEGTHSGDLTRSVSWGLRMGLIIPAFTVLARIISSSFVPQDGIFQHQLSAKDILWLITVIGVSPFVREALFRGTFYRMLRDAVGILPAALLSNAAFAFSNGLPVTFDGAVTVPIMGFLATIAYQKSGSLSAAVIVAALYNLIVVVYYIQG